MSKEKKEDLPEDKREKMLERFRKKLKGLSEKQKDDVIRRAFKKLVENGALEYEDFKKIIADTLGYGELTEEQSKKFTELVNKGHIYIAQPPLYQLKKGSSVQYAYSDEEKNKIIAELGGIAEEAEVDFVLLGDRKSVV